VYDRCRLARRVAVCCPVHAVADTDVEHALAVWRRRCAKNFLHEMLLGRAYYDASRIPRAVRSRKGHRLVHERRSDVIRGCPPISGAPGVGRVASDVPSLSASRGWRSSSAALARSPIVPLPVGICPTLLSRGGVAAQRHGVPGAKRRAEECLRAPGTAPLYRQTRGVEASSG